ncbi:MAG: hypothetical protein WB767_14765 [Nocardioides sp.]
MGGGWGKQGSGVPLAERVRGDVAPSAAVDVCPSRHCWVGDAVDGLGVKRPGLLVEWRQSAGRWEGRVIYAARLRDAEWVTVEEWLPAALLTPL